MVAVRLKCKNTRHLFHGRIPSPDDGQTGRSRARRAACTPYSSLCALVRPDPSAHPDFDLHACERVSPAKGAAPHRHHLGYVAGSGDGNQVEATDASIGQIKVDPARAGHIDICPCPTQSLFSYAVLSLASSASSSSQRAFAFSKAFFSCATFFNASSS